eukprot:TRINITY_DN2612_c0_g2_i3.p1 TRINITY_DN2612_c0_g2~~TRINITY_DN2612_c0_g2_i3.p1  ORF type:complete len:813 (+),score=192.01 TRINITY_DN2612_c0_g2_i3:180-2618(+)
MATATMGPSSTIRGASEPRICEPGGMGLLLPQGGEFEQKLDNRLKVFLYGAGLIYCFLGVGVISDVFMSAIERITSKKKRVPIEDSDRKVTMNVWNETVANLTLMALGSSAPEILLAIGDVLKNNFFAGALGPSTIVGSAAFNLFVIIAVCINAIPGGETRQIKEMGVFVITAVWSIWAYLWLLIIVSFWSPPIVTLIEGALTVVFFPLLVWMSYASDVGMLSREYMGECLSKTFDLSGAGEGCARRGFAICVICCTGCCTPVVWLLKIFFMALKCLFWPVLAICRCCAGACCSKSRAAAEQQQLAQKGCKKGSPEAGAKCDKIAEEDDVTLEIEGMDDDEPILEENGKPIDIAQGVFTFRYEYMEVWVGGEEKEIKIPVLRKNGQLGRVSVCYRMEGMTATPGYDYEEDDGTLEFKSGEKSAEVTVSLLPKRPGERDDVMQIILEEPDGGAILNPESDGDEDACILTILLRNELGEATSCCACLYGFLDGLLNIDEICLGTEAWKDQIFEAIFVNGSYEDQQDAHWTDWVSHFISFPWNFYYALLTPPPVYIGGWICFCGALMHIGCLTSIIGDLAELFGCAGGVDDAITAITFVALGTSLPDTFASKTAATQDDCADASIVNVTGSNSVNVFLGIGLPWFMAAVYWHFTGPNEEWLKRYEVEYLFKYPDAGFIVTGSGDLAFSVVVFTIAALVCLVVIRLRRVFCGGELGGEANTKAVSSFLLIMLWVTYIGLQIWKSGAGANADLTMQATAIALCIPVLTALMVLFLGLMQVVRLSKHYLSLEGVGVISIGVGFIAVRLIIFFAMQHAG